MKLFTSLQSNNLEATKLIPLLLLFLIACGDSSSDSVSVPPSPFSEKISNIMITDSAVFFAVEVAEGRYELFGIDPVTGARNDISDVFSANTSLTPVGISPDGTRIAYRADRDNNGTDELYSNLVDGTNEIQLSSLLETSTDRINWQWMPDSSRIIFRSDPDSDGIFEVQSILPDGSDLQMISADLSVTCDVTLCWKIADDSSVVTFKTESLNQNSQISQNLFAVSAGGSGLTQLNQTLNVDSRINGWKFAPNSLLVAYTSQNAGEVSQLYTVQADASARTLLNNNSLTVGVEYFVWAPDSSHIAFTDDSLTAGLASLYVDLPDATDRIHLIDTFEVANPVVFDWRWAPDSSRIAYTADQETQGIFELFTVQNDGQWHRTMNAPLPENGVVQNEWQWSPSSDFIAFYAEANVDQDYDELYSASADASQLSQVNLLHDDGLFITRQHWTLDGSRLIYSTTRADGGVNAIYSVLSDGSNVTQLTNSLQDSENIKSGYLISPDSTNIIYQIDSFDASNSSLHIGSVSQSNRLNLVSLGKVLNAYWLNDSSRIIYLVKTDDNISEQMFSILADGTDKVRLY